MDIPVKLETTIHNIHLLDNSNNVKLIYEFYLYLRSVNTSESYQNQNIKALINMAKFIGKDVNFTSILKKEEILYFLNTKVKGKEEDPDGKWMKTWNHCLQRIMYFFRWLYNEKLRAERDESLSSSFLNVLPVNATFPSILSVLLMIIIYGIKSKSIPQFDI